MSNKKVNFLGESFIKEGQLRVFKFRSLAGKKFIVLKVFSNQAVEDVDILMLPDCVSREENSWNVSESVINRALHYLVSASDLITEALEDEE